MSKSPDVANATARPRPFICGCAGTVVTEDERAFYQAAQPFGFILMGRNCQNPEQVQALVRDLRACVAHPDAPVLIDMEGGRVARLKPPHWPVFPAAALIGTLYHYDAALGIEFATLAGKRIGQTLHSLGITVDCAPVLDIGHAATHDAIGDRAFSGDARAVGLLGHAFAEGLLAAGVLPVIKHLPGHGYAEVDPHLSLPVVEEDAETVMADFAPFRMLAAMPIGMTSHVLFKVFDPELPASQSPLIVRDIIRRAIGFNGLLLSDDLDMKALGGDLASRSAQVLAAGTDVLLICNTPVAALSPYLTLPPMTGMAWQRWERAHRFLEAPSKQEQDQAAQQARLTALWRLAEEQGARTAASLQG